MVLFCSTPFRVSARISHWRNHLQLFQKATESNHEITAFFVIKDLLQKKKFYFKILEIYYSSALHKVAFILTFYGLLHVAVGWEYQRDALNWQNLGTPIMFDVTRIPTMMNYDGKRWIEYKDPYSGVQKSREEKKLLSFWKRIHRLTHQRFSYTNRHNSGFFFVIMPFTCINNRGTKILGKSEVHN